MLQMTYLITNILKLLSYQITTSNTFIWIIIIYLYILYD